MDQGFPAIRLPGRQRRQRYIWDSLGLFGGFYHLGIHLSRYSKKRVEYFVQTPPSSWFRILSSSRYPGRYQSRGEDVRKPRISESALRFIPTIQTEDIPEDSGYRRTSSHCSDQRLVIHARTRAG